MKLEDLAVSKLSSCEIKEINGSDMGNHNWNLAFSLGQTHTVEEFASAWAHQKQHFKNGMCSFCEEYKKVNLITREEDPFANIGRS